MALTYITTILPGPGIDFYMEDALAVPTDLTPRAGSIVVCMTSVGGAILPIWYLKLGATTLGSYVRFVNDALANAAGTLTFKPTYWFNLSLSASVGGGTQTTTLPAVGAASWRIVDAYIINTSGAAGGGSVKLQAATGSLDITNTMAPGAINEKTPAVLLNYDNGAMALGATLNFVKAAGFTASRVFVRVEGV